MKVWVTRDEPSDGPLSTALRQAGLEVVNEPVLTRRVVSDCRAEIESLREGDWLVFTSAFAVKAAHQPDPVVFKVASVGEATKQAAEDAGWIVDFVSEGGDGASLFAELAPLSGGRTICYPRSSQAKPPILASDITLLSPVAYETEPRPYRAEVVNEVDVIAVASPSAVRAVLATGKVNKPFASIGPTTSAALRELVIEPWV
ncbi:MAG: uroporphyrinogen-III synthase, partial [Proteobacteria bacterium]|nr:uroporphyrinogen-III synthase [Pseudomonadota bacterium]